MKTSFKSVGIRVKDLEKSVAFYAKLLGMKVEGRSKIEETKGVVVNLKSEDGLILDLNYYAKDSPHNTKYVVGEGLDHLAFKVEDLDRSLSEARSEGYPTVLEVKTKKSRWAYIKDPNGIWIELY